MSRLCLELCLCGAINNQEAGESNNSRISWEADLTTLAALL